ncbi:zeta toxin family protein [Lacrimispora algidixylanolytica]|uniref:UDP-N-acetylglucosamine kinase n=1 Tax=Lacrimispora algidixylanolytica TaxID=94868 RepID=A0A419TCE0_9FIRM|nr:zeta toxin family protein [Lacrimispora algidixylanolytica]RKD35151.1 ATPase [Lacrimispora algidixylanolytica]
MKRYVIFAGVNGAGKSTLYLTFPKYQQMPRINTDEILRTFGDWRITGDVMKAGKLAVQELKRCLSDGISFNQETTLCGKTIFKTIETARNQGYYIELYYVGVNSVELAKQRIAYRVSKGGHGIPDKDVEKRYLETFQNLKTILPMCNLASLYDNTKQFRRIAIYKDGIPVRISHNMPEWFQRIQ